MPASCRAPRRERQRGLGGPRSSGEDGHLGREELDVIIPCLERLRAEGLLSDARFAETFVRMHRNKGHGPLRILRDLAQRGVASELAEAAVDARSRDWHELARAWKERRYGTQPPASAAEWQRVARQLQQRGFMPEQIRYALTESNDRMAR